MQYFFLDENGKQKGPVEKTQLISHGVKGSTLIWSAGMSGWTKASEVNELKMLFAAAPAPVPRPSQFTPANHRPRTKGAVPPPPGGETGSTTNPNQNRFDNANYQIPPKTWMVESILVTLFCCMPFGIAGIVNAASVESKFYSGDHIGAQRASANAKKWTTISFWIGVVVSLLYFFAAIGGSL